MIFRLLNRMMGIRQLVLLKYTIKNKLQTDVNSGNMMGTEILFTKSKVLWIEYILHGVCHKVCPTVH